MINEIIKILFMLSYIGVFFYLIRKKKQTVLFATIVIINLGVMLSLILIEFGLFIYEQQISGYENNSFYIFYFFSLSSLLLFYFLSKNKSILMAIQNSKKKRLFLPIAVTFIAVLLYSISKNPDYTRFDIFDGPFKMLFVRIEYIFIFIFIYSLFRTKSLNQKFIYLIIFWILMFMRGSQFGAFMIALIWFFMAYYLQDGKIHLKWIPIFSLLIIIPFYIKLSMTDLAYVGQRIIMEGHVFWGTINVFNQQGINLDFSGFFNNYNDLFSGFQQGNIDYGFGKLMYAVSPHFAEMLLGAGVRFSAGYPAILIYHFGLYFGFLLHLFFTYLFYLFIQYLVYCFKYRDVFYSYIIYMFFMIYSDFLIQGEYAHFRFKFLIKIGILLFVLFLYNNYSKSKVQNILVN